MHIVLDSVAGCRSAVPANHTFFNSQFDLRACPGRRLADTSIFIMIASILSVFHISKQRDELGNEIQVLPSFSEDGPVRFVSSFCVKRVSIIV
jgi:hypothetical protein